MARSCASSRGLSCTTSRAGRAPTYVPAVEDDPFADDMDEAAAALAENLSPESAWTLGRLARPLAEGAKISTVAHEAGVTIAQARRGLEELREELEAQAA